MGDDADVGVESGARPEREQVPALLGVDQEDLLAGAKEAAVDDRRGGVGHGLGDRPLGTPLGVHGAQEPELDVEPGGLEEMTRRSPGFSLVR